MRCLNRNKREFWYSLYANSAEEIYDEYGNATGEYIPTYETPDSMSANISPANGRTAVEMFGTTENYDKVIVTDWIDCPIDEQTVLWIDRTPDEGSYDYIVKRVARSINSVTYAVSKVNVRTAAQIGGGNDASC